MLPVIVATDYLNMSESFCVTVSHMDRFTCIANFYNLQWAQYFNHIKGGCLLLMCMYMEI